MSRLHRPISSAVPRLLATAAGLMLTGCGDPAPVWQCQLDDSTPDFATTIGCADDFAALASEPLSASIPGARSVKTVIDRFADSALYFQNSTRYATHWEFASAELSGDGLPVVPLLADFSLTEYSSPSRRFVLGAVTYYEGPEVYAYELAPYDSADSDMVADAYRRIAERAFFGAELFFHPTSDSLEALAVTLPDDVRIITTEELYAGIDFQALNVGVSYGQLTFATAASLATTYVGFRDIVVLDQVPNDISVVMGIITSEFQTPLSHVNVLSQNRGTPNMALRGAHDRPDLQALEGAWVRLEVTLSGYTLEEVPRAEADAWWEDNKPAEVQVPGLDLSIAALTDIEEVVGEALDGQGQSLFDAIKGATRAFGGKAAHYSALSRIESVPSPKAFAIPVFHYTQFMQQNGFDAQVAAMLADEAFQNDAGERDRQLEALREAMKVAPVDAQFEAALLDKLATDYPGIRMRFRSSTNAEDLDGFTGAGLYTSRSGDPDDPTRPVLDAVRAVWASIWNFRAFEERTYRSIDHTAVGMAMLVHRSFPDEERNGVALTNNPFDPSGLETPFYINVQIGETSVVQPPPGVTSDQLLYYHDRPGQPAVYVAHSSLVAPGYTVLDNAQLFELGSALAEIRAYFAPAYAIDGGWWAMDVEFKFDGEPGQTPQLFVKQARPYGGR